MKLRKGEIEITNAYKLLKIQNSGRVPNRTTLIQFINTYFSDDPLVKWVPPDFTDKPTIVNYISDLTYKYYQHNVTLTKNNFSLSHAIEVCHSVRL